MNKKDAALSTLVSMGIAVSAAIVASQLEIQLEEAKKNPTKETKSKAESPPRVYETIGGPKQWDHVADVVIVGSGAAGLMAGISALWTKPDARIMIVEGASQVGGTTAKSGGVFWLPNNVRMTVPDSKEQTVSLMARLGFPDKFNANEPCLGLEEDEYSRLCQFYELGRPVSAQLQTIAYHLNRVKDAEGRFLFDYTFSARAQPDNVAPQQRHLAIGLPSAQRAVLRSLSSVVSLTLPLLRKMQEAFPLLKEVTTLSSFGLNLTFGFGVHLVEALEREFSRTGQGRIQLDSIVDGLVLDDGSVVGVRIFNSKTGKQEFVGARRGVVFASGGYSQDQSLVKHHLIDSGRFVHRSGASSQNTGVFVHLAERLGANMSDDDMKRIWGCEAVLDDSAPWETPTCMFQMRGDSMFVVGPNGKRIYNEKSKYDLRSRVHWNLPRNSCADPSKDVLFMICDERCQNIFGSEVLANTWPRDPNDPRYIKAASIDELAKKITERYPNYINAKEFQLNVPLTVERFNSFARKGIDEDFRRGNECPSDEQWTFTGLSGETTSQAPNRAMFPLSINGPFFALPIVSSIIDTKGGPKIDSQGRVLAKDDDSPIDRLYAAGNCARCVTGDAYISGGGTLGPALVSGYVAGMNAILRGPGGAKL